MTVRDTGGGWATGRGPPRLAAGKLELSEQSGIRNSEVRFRPDSVSTSQDSESVTADDSES